MTMGRRKLVMSGLVALACTAGPQAAVQISSPAEGESAAGSVLVRLTAMGVKVVPASGVAVAGEGHHHVFVDVDPGAAAGPILTGPGIFHMGKGVDTLRLDSLTAGPHRLIAVFAAGDHVPMVEVRRDTVDFMVRSP
jgi:hypothetical protein